MKRHDETMLWEYAADELAADDAKLLEHHLDECLECREGLLEVRKARALLDDATAPRPVVAWAKVDAGISQLVEARLVKQAKANNSAWRWSLGVACTAALVAVLAVGLKVRVAAPAPAEGVALSPNAGTHVDQAIGLSRIGLDVEAAGRGEYLKTGEVLRTSAEGHAVLTLPDESRIRLSPGTQLALTRAEADDVSLTLEQGRVAVHASHRPRKGFVVHAGGLGVRVVGTLFTVEQMAGALEVAVVEGKVRVEPPEGDALFLLPGQRVRFEQGGWTPVRGEVSPSQLGDFADLSVPPMVQAQGAARPAPGGVVPAPAPEHNGLLPRLSPQVSASRVKPAPAPVAKRPSMASSGTLAVMGSQPPAPAGEKAASSKLTEPEELQAWPVAPPQPPAQPAPAAEPEAVKPALDVTPFPVVSNQAEPARAKAEPLPVDLETLFLQRAERALGRGICENYLQGLDELASDLSRGERAERARILRARCFDAKIRPDLSEREYRHYLVNWPTGRFALEARQATAD